MDKTAKISELNQMAKKLRSDVVDMLGVGKVGHLGGSCSSADIIAALYFYKMKYDPKNPKWEGRDRFLFSKGHAALVQYAALGEMGVIDKAAFKTVKSLGSSLQGHPDMNKTPGIEANTGSLGQGVSIAVGMALGFKLDKKDNRVYVIMGDGEIAEGQIWEALMSAANYKLDNLTCILDRNKLQAMGPCAERFDTGDLKAKFAAFGAHVIEIDGHDMAQVVDALDTAETIKGKPTVIVANTVKSKGVSFAENVVGFHNGMLTQEQYDKAKAELA